MTSPELENLVRLGHVKREACSQRDFDNLVKSGAKGHERRNLSEYEGVLDVDERY